MIKPENEHLTGPSGLPFGASAQETTPSSAFFHELSLDPASVRNPEILKFINQHNFIPYYRREITMANKKLGLADALFEARYSNNNANNPLENQIRAAEKTYEGAEKYVAKSADALSSLRLAYQEDQTAPSPQEIKSNPQIIDVIANFILTFRKVEAEYWPAWNAEILASALEQIKARLSMVSDEEAVALWDMTRINNNERLKFWSGQLISVKDNIIVKEINASRDARQKSPSDESVADQPGGTAEYEIMSELSETAVPTEDEVDGKPIWETYVPPNGQIRIEGTDQVQLITDTPVARPPKREPVKSPGTEVLFDMPKPEKDKTKSAQSKHKRRPYRARYSDTTDDSLRALRQGLEDMTLPSSNPDADLDEIFGPAAK